MNVLTNWLKLLHDDCNFKVRFNTLDKEYYEEQWESINKSCIRVKAPDFFFKNVELGDIGENLKSTYAQMLIENAGYRQPHEFILTGIANIKDKIFLYFSSKFSNWSSKRIVIIKDNRVIRNDFKKVYDLSWNDYKNHRYMKTNEESEKMKIKLRRPTLTPNSN